MANPQLSKGHTRIANELLQITIKYMTNPSWLRISLLVWRITYGYQRKDAISNYKSFITFLDLTEEYIKQILLEMESAKIISYKPLDTFRFKVGFNKNYEAWNIYK